METANFSLFAANGKWKQQTSVCLLQMEKENGSLFPLVDKDKRWTIIFFIKFKNLFSKSYNIVH